MLALAGFPCVHLVPPAIEACSTDRTRDAWHSLPPAFDREPRRDTISWFFSRSLRRKAHKWQPSLGWLFLRPVRGATEDSGPRDEHVSADLSRCRHAMSARHLCRRSASGSALTTRFSTRLARRFLRRKSARWAPSFARWCHICLEQRARVLFGSTTTKNHGVSTAGPSPSTVLRGRLRHAIGSRVTLH